MVDAPFSEDFYRQLAEHDPVALSTLFKYARLLEVVLHRRFGRAIQDDDLHDIVADALIHAWERGHCFDHRQSTFKSWLIIMAVYHAREFLRRTMRDRCVPLEHAKHCPVPVNCGPGGLLEPSLHLKRVIDQLPVRRATIIRMFYYEGHPIAEIAMQLQITEAAVKSHLSNGRASLRSAVDLECASP